MSSKTINKKSTDTVGIADLYEKNDIGHNKNITDLLHEASGLYNLFNVDKEQKININRVLLLKGGMNEGVDELEISICELKNEKNNTNSFLRERISIVVNKLIQEFVFKLSKLLNYVIELQSIDNTFELNNDTKKLLVSFSQKALATLNEDHKNIQEPQQGNSEYWQPAILESSTKLNDKENIDFVLNRANQIVTLLDNKDIKSLSQDEILDLPTSLPEPMEKGEKGRYEKFAYRENEKETALEFLERVWGKYIQAGLLYQTDLRGQQKNKKSNGKRGLDKTLFDAISLECRDKGFTLKDYIPTKSDKIINKVVNLFSEQQEKENIKAVLMKNKNSLSSFQRQNKHFDKVST